MAKKIPPKKKPAIKKQVKDQHPVIAVIIILLLTLIAFSPAFSAQFVNWDDPDYILQNKMITGMGMNNIEAMFSTFYMGNYHPLTIFTNSIEYYFVQQHPFLYHFDNVLLHLLNTFLVFVFAYRITRKQLMTAAFTALLFGIHPMHVESVAWISERKDTLHVLFLLFAMICYVKYVQHGLIKKYYWYTLLFFLLALLSKAQAVVLAPLLLIIDYVADRKPDKKTLLEKVPFFIIALGFGLLAIAAQNSGDPVNQVHLKLYQVPFVGVYGFIIYIFKAFVPTGLSALHPYPTGTNGSLPMMVYLSPIIAFVILFLAIKFFKNNKKVMFGFLFFTISIFPVLQFLPVGEAIIAERYSYFPYIGLFFSIGYIIANLDGFKVLKGYFTPIRIFFFIGLALLLVICYSRTKIWKDSITLWSDCIEKYPGSRTAYNNRGYMYNQTGEYDKAMADLNKGISLDPVYAKLYMNRGVTFERRQLWDSAIRDYSTCIKLNPAEDKAYMNRGIIFTDHKPDYDQAIKDFNEVLRLRPDKEDARTSKGIAYFKKGDDATAIKLYSEGLQHNALNYLLYYLRARAYADLKEYKKALEDFTIARNNGIVADPAFLQLLEDNSGK